MLTAIAVAKSLKLSKAKVVILDYQEGLVWIQ